VLVVVGRVPDVAVLAVDEVEVIVVGDRRVPAAVGVDVHVPAMGQVPVLAGRGDVVHVIVVGVVDVAVVQEIQVIVVGDRRMAAKAIVRVVVFVVGLMTRGLHEVMVRRPAEEP
jgi:phage tail sheath gpL-like